MTELKIRLKELVLNCRTADRRISFSKQVSFFYGPMSVGKSSIPRLVNYCLGGRLVETPALAQEMVAATLVAQIGLYDVEIRRQFRSRFAEVTWRIGVGNWEKARLPIERREGDDEASHEEWGELSNLLFHFWDMAAPKVRAGSSEHSTSLAELGLQDFMTYCYLDDREMDSSFFDLDDRYRGPRSREVLRYLLGFHNERLSELESRHRQKEYERRQVAENAAQLNRLLSRFGYRTPLEVGGELTHLQADLAATEMEQAALRDRSATHPHVVDELREELRFWSERLGEEEQTLADLDRVISDQRQLRAELQTAKTKIGRSGVASSILLPIAFKICPACSTPLDASRRREPGTCELCGRPTTEARQESALNLAEADVDFAARIEELSDSLARHESEREVQVSLVDRRRREKAELDQRLANLMRDYDDVFLARLLEVEARVAALREKIASAEREAAVADEVRRIVEQSDKLRLEADKIGRDIDHEKAKTTRSDFLLAAVKATYLESLRAVGVPGVGENDLVSIDTSKSWIPWIVPGGRFEGRWSFESAGRGRGTLLKLCYALSIHAVAAAHDLPMPTLLMIDTPTKGIDNSADEKVFDAFYRYAYDLAAGPLSDSQLVIIDGKFTDPGSPRLDVMPKLMTRDDLNNPPLVPGYHD